MRELMRGQNSISRTKAEDGKLYVHTTFYNDESIKRNQQILNEGVLEKSELGIHDNADIRFWFRPTDMLEWNFFQRKFPDIYKGLHSKDEKIRLSAALKLSILHPGWVIFERA